MKMDIILAAGMIACAAIPRGWSAEGDKADVQAPDGQELAAEIASLRDPFWPIGWTPPEETVVTSVAEERPVVVKKSAPVRWEDARKMIRVTGLSKTADGKYLAILKGIGVVEESDIVTVTLDDFVYKWRIGAITEDGIAPEQVGVFPGKEKNIRRNHDNPE